MKRHYSPATVASIAFSAVGAFCGSNAVAQSSVGIYGIVDACYSRADLGAASNARVSPGCSAGNRLGFRGTEDLGGGMRAYFQLENGFNIDDGSIGQGGRFFGRKAIVGLSSDGVGGLELGRDYAPTFYLLAPVDPTSFGIGTIGNTMWTGSNPTTVARNDNAINYVSPSSWGPFGFRAQHSLGEPAAGQPKQGRDTTGFNATYRSGPVYAGLAYATHNNPADNGQDKAVTLAGRYNFSSWNIAAAYQIGQWEGSRTAVAPASSTSIFSRDYRSWMVGGSVNTWASGRIILSLKGYEDRTSGNFDAKQLTIIAMHSLSKRTDLYAGYSRLRNATGGSYAISDATTSYSGVTPGASTSVIALGVRHTF